MMYIKWWMISEWFWNSKYGRWVCNRDDHSPGVWWYNPHSCEPDMHCKRCGLDLG